MPSYIPTSPTSSDGDATDSGRDTNNTTFGANRKAVVETSLYCAYHNDRSLAARRRNYNNCSECKKARQRCTQSEEGACDRCKRLGKTCNLLSMMNSGSGSGPRRSTTMEEEERLFGRVLYRLHDGSGHIMIIHVKPGNNGVQQVFKSLCDQNDRLVAPAEYLSPWSEYSRTLARSVYNVDVDAMMAARSSPSN